MQAVFARVSDRAITDGQQSCNRVGSPRTRCYGALVVTSQLTRSPRAAFARLTVAASIATFATLLGGSSAHAYPQPGYAGVLSATCTIASQGQQCPVTFTLTQPGGQPAAGVAAQFTVSSCGTVSPTTGTTDANGQFTTMFTAGQRCCGTATVTATAPSVGVTVQTQITITCPGLLPATGSATPPPGHVPSPWAPATLLAAALALVAGLAALLITRRRATPA
jgi:hypothetical protein